MPLIGQKIIQRPEQIRPKPSFVLTGCGKRVPAQQAGEELLCEILRIVERKATAPHFGIDRIPVAAAKLLQRRGRIRGNTIASHRDEAPVRGVKRSADASDILVEIWLLGHVERRGYSPDAVMFTTLGRDSPARPGGTLLPLFETRPSRTAPNNKTSARFNFETQKAPAYRLAPMDEVSSASTRVDGRLPHQIRPIHFQNHIAPYATGSTLIEWGSTRVICGVTVEDIVPRWMKEQGVVGGWITAEYSMLPYSTLQRKQRDINKGKIDGRSQEIQRLIGRAMRACINLEKIGSRTIWVDCDVLQADGGTRTAAITGAYVALALAVRKLMADGKLTDNPLLSAVAAVSVGIVRGQALLDLNYLEDVAAAVDMNLVMNAGDEFIEVQGTGEEATFTRDQLDSLLEFGRIGIRELLDAQNRALAQAAVL
jgi:ribonuclease PH